MAEVMWRLNQDPGTLVSVNNLTNYDAAIDPDPWDLRDNDLDDDGDGAVDEADELNWNMDWQVRLLHTLDAPSVSDPEVYTDTTPTGGTDRGHHLVVATVQPEVNWREYSTATSSDSEVMLVRFKLESDTSLGDQEGDGDEIIFFDNLIVTNDTPDVTTITSLGDTTNALDDSPYNINYDDGTTDFPATGQPVLLVTTTARVKRGGREVAEKSITAEVYRRQERVITKAMCGCTDLDITGGGGSDSYKSSEGPYGTAIYQNGDVGSNADIKMGGGALVSGNADAGGSITFSGSNATVEKDAKAGGTIDTGGINVLGDVKPNYLPPPNPCNCTAVDVVDEVNQAAIANDNLTAMLPNGVNPYNYPGPTIGGGSIYLGGMSLKLTNDESIILTGGTYYFDSISVSGSASIQVGQDLGPIGDGIADAPPTEPVMIYVSGGITLGGGGLVNASRPTDLLIFCSSTTADIGISGSSDFRGSIYAPLTDIDITGGADVYGAFLGADVKNSGGAPVHFDEDLMDIMIMPGEFAAIAWYLEN